MPHTIEATTPPWRPKVDDALNTGPLAREMCLSTCTPDGPRARHVTFQDFTPSNLIVVATDRSSSKIAEMSIQPHIEIAWFVPAEAVQFRIRGIAAPIGEATEFLRSRLALHLSSAHPEGQYAFWKRERERIWDSLGPMTRKYDHPPLPGTVAPEGTDDAHFNFNLVAIRPQRVEVLDLLAKSYTTYVETHGLWHVEGAPATEESEERAHL